MLTLFNPAGFVDNPGLDRFEVRHYFSTNHLPQCGLVPRTIGHELLKPLRINAYPWLRIERAFSVSIRAP
jgi:hypothetical protein